MFPYQAVHSRDVYSRRFLFLGSHVFRSSFPFLVPTIPETWLLRSRDIVGDKIKEKRAMADEMDNCEELGWMS
jgi:hypothetical protein